MSSAREEKLSAHSSSNSAEEPSKQTTTPLEKPSRKKVWPWGKSKQTQSLPPKKELEEDPLSHLTSHEKDVIKRQLASPAVQVKYSTLFRYATRNDMLLIVLSAFCAIAAGAIQPLMTILFGNLAGTFQQFFLGELSGSGFSHQLSHFTLYFIYLAIAEFITTYIATVGFLYTGEHITQKIREHYLAAILRQNIGYFDKLGAGEITTRITADTSLVQDGISEKIGLALTGAAAFVTAFIIAYVKYWKLALILTSTIVCIVVTMGAGSTFIVKFNKKSLDSYAVGGTVAEEVLSSIRNATAFSTQDKLARQYDTHLTIAERWGFRHKAILGSMMGALFWIIFANYALAFWQGSRYLVTGEGGVHLSTVLTILLAIIIGAFNLGHVGPHVQAFATATAAGAKIFTTIDRKSPLDPESTEGKVLESIEGKIELRNIRHIYPSRPEVVVMDDVSLNVPAARSTALVGASGSGKSTIVGLIERFYDPVGGDIFIDGYNIRDLNLQFLRRQISLVSQEPTLFGTTIFNNIAHGLIGTEFETASLEKRTILIHDAARMANAHDFITNLPDGYETHVGERGFLLSGGQKQRIAIARAVVSDPKILLLDEATSALDTKSEGVVQAALDKASQGRTTIIIAHRLSTIKDCDNIVVMSRGAIVEQGTHNELLERKSAYYHLVEAQKIVAATKEREGEEEDGEAFEEHEELELQRSRGSGLNRRMSAAESNNLVRTTTSKSVSSAVLRNRTPKRETQYSLWTLIKLVGSFNRNEWHLMLLGLFFSIIAGGGNPTQAVFFAECISAMTLPPSEYGKLRSEVNFWTGMYLMLAFVQLLSYAGQGIVFAYCSERLVHRVRDRSFRTMLRQDIGFFDREENTAGALTSFLSTETTQLAGMSGATLGTILTVLTTLIAACCLGLAFDPKLAGVCISTIPILLGCGFCRFWMLTRFEARAKRAYAKSASYACEATSAIRTVASLTREKDVWEHYHNQLVSQRQSSLQSNLKSSLLFAASQSFILLCVALGFWYGGTLISKGELTQLQFFICFTAIIFGAQSAGTIFSFAPDMGKAKRAANELMTLFDIQPEIDSWSDAGEKPTGVKGAIEFTDVHFRYPTRPEQPVLRGLNLHVNPGQYIALVGPSGCGKSTTIALLERFYDPLSGSIKLDGQDITGLNINEYRSHLALVSQEPTLYQGTIRENILLGADHPEDMPDLDARIEQACREANIFDFISSLPDGMATVVGNKGVMLSGGQKQRIAIARALLRDPKVLLLDEATSALDSESEKVVQQALDQAAKGRTTIAVAHRLSTIQHADIIFVFENGRIVEKGRHKELMNQHGRYFELVSLQSLEKLA